MSATVPVYCPDCDGASADYRLPPCDTCHCNGHLYVNREPDGSVPARLYIASRDEWVAVREWVPLMLGEVPRG